MLKRKLKSARHRYGSIKSMTLDDAERLLQACCGKKTDAARGLAAHPRGDVTVERLRRHWRARARQAHHARLNVG